MLQPREATAGHSRDHHGQSLIALYPGSFKPPNASHMHAIGHLLNVVHANKVVVIISNRCRPVPGTNLAVDAASAVLLFKKMLRKSALPMDRVELVIARHRAVAEAVAYIGSSVRNTSLLFCVGEEDYQSSDDRFSNIRSLAEENGVSARVYVLPTPGKNVHSSQLREQLAQANAGMRGYIEGLPANLSLRDRVDLWSDCKDQLRPICEIVRPKLVASLRNNYEMSDACVRQKDASTIDPTYELRAANGELLVVKYAGDTTSAGAFGDRFIQKPARRIAVEKRATQYLASQLSHSVFPTRVDFYDREIRLIVLAGRTVGATAAEFEISNGIFRKDVARQSGDILAKIHKCPVPASGFWSDSATDHGHWQTVIAALMVRARKAAEQASVESQQFDHIDALVSSARPQVLHMCFTPDNLWCNHERVTIENLECASNFGDPAYDVASLVSSYLISGIQHAALRDCIAAIAEFEMAYLAANSSDDHSFTGRVSIYAACQILASTIFVSQQKQIDERVSWAVDLMRLGNKAYESKSRIKIAELLQER